MKKKAVVSLWAAVALAVVLFNQTTAAMQATNPNSSPTAQEAAPQPDPPSAATEAKTFSGKIVKSGDKFILKDAAGKTIYQLDDQDKAKEYAGKSVKVSGTLDAATSRIRVSNIEPAT